MRDIELQADGDILLIDGDIRWTTDAEQITRQHLRDIVIARPFDFRLTTIGVGYEDYLEDDDQDNLFHAIRTNIARDKCKPIFVGVVKKKLVVRGKY